jgi:[ribosomal protein S5]-alanine N-acetyltransferase
LTLRAPRLSDAGAIFNTYAQHPEVTRYLLWKPHSDVKETGRFLVGCVAAWRNGGRFPWVITFRVRGGLAGMVELRVNVPHVRLEGVVARPHRGRGIAFEALRPLVEWAQEGIHRVWAVCGVENVASARTLEKAGMRREGRLRRNIVHPNTGGEPRDSYCYAAVK